MVKLYPVLETVDICYGYRYGWLEKLLEVADTIMLRPEPVLGEAFKRRLTLARYLAWKCNVPLDVVGKLKIMLDHGIYVDGETFAKTFHVPKTPKALVELYSVLGVDYGLAYDVPAQLHVDAAVEIAVSKMFGRQPNKKMLRAIHPALKQCVEHLADTLLAHTNKHTTPANAKRAMHALLREGKHPELREALRNLSQKSIEETVRNLEQQLEYKVKTDAKFTLVPVVQGLFEDHARECLQTTIDLLATHRELLVDGGERYAYIAIGTSGRGLTEEETKTVNRLMVVGAEHARRLGLKTRYHLLGWSSPKTAQKLTTKLIYSCDSLTPRRRAVEGKVYIVEGGRVRLVNVAKIDPSTWTCKCPVCRDPKLKQYVLDSSGARRNDARIIHNVYVLQKHVLTRRTLNLLSFL